MEYFLMQNLGYDFNDAIFNEKPRRMMDEKSETLFFFVSTIVCHLLCPSFREKTCFVLTIIMIVYIQQFCRLENAGIYCE